MNSTWYKRREESVRTSLKRFLLLYLGEPLHRLLRFVSALIIRHYDYQKKTDLDGIKIPLLGHCTVKPRLTYTRLIRTVCFVPENIFSNCNPLDTTCLVPRRLSLSMKMCAQKKAGRRQLYPFHGPLRFITSQSSFALDSTMRKTKRPSRKLGFDSMTEKISSTPKISWKLRKAIGPIGIPSS